MKCGTYAGYQQHVKGGTDPCAPCRAANARYGAHLRHMKDYQRRAERFVELGVAQ